MGGWAGINPYTRRAFPWDRASWDGGLLAFTTAAFALRHAEPLLRQGQTEIAGADADWVAIRRFDPSRPAAASLVVVANAGTEWVRVPIAGDAAAIQVLVLPT